MVITKALLSKGASKKGCFNHKQLKVLGVEIPLKAGWYQKLIGGEVSPEAYERFLALKDAHTKPSLMQELPLFTLTCPHCQQIFTLKAEVSNG